MSESEEDLKNIKIMEEIENQFLSLLPLLERYLDKEDTDFLIELITHSECGIAFEEIVHALIYYKVALTDEEFEEIVLAGNMIKRSPSTWEKLKELIK